MLMHRFKFTRSQCPCLLFIWFWLIVSDTSITNFLVEQPIEGQSLQCLAFHLLNHGLWSAIQHMSWSGSQPGAEPPVLVLKHAWSSFYWPFQGMKGRVNLVQSQVLNPSAATWHFIHCAIGLHLLLLSIKFSTHWILYQISWDHQFQFILITM